MSELLSSGVPVAAGEALAIVQALAPHASAQACGPFPSLDEIYVTADGVRIGSADEGVSGVRSPIGWLASVLQALLAYSDPDDDAFPLGLRFLGSRATGHRFGRPREPMDVGAFRPFATLAELTSALGKFSPPDGDAAIDRLFERAAATRAA